jgi:ABC-type antimicrobial peptide transport system permease subunit
MNAASATTKQIDPRIVVHAEPLTAQLERHLAPARLASALAGVLGILALLLATVGVFGVFAYVVRQRTQEIGIRIALGARPAEILTVVLGACSPSLLAGFALGMLISIATSRAIHSFLYGLSEFDARAYGSVCLVLLAAAVTATWIPARRAMHVEPIHALRYE